MSKVVTKKLIPGHKYTAASMANLEAKSLSEYGKKPVKFIDSIAYYDVLFQAFLVQHGDRKFKAMPSEQRRQIYEEENRMFVRAMQYCFTKGHQTTFAIILMNVKGKNGFTFDRDWMAKTTSKSYFIYKIDKMVSPDVVTNRLGRDANAQLINYTRQHFENGHRFIMQMSRIFFKKGAEVAFDQIRSKILQISPKVSTYTRLLEEPLNENFAVTPAFNATFCFESPGYEEWKIHWDDTYGYKIAKAKIGTIQIHAMKFSSIKEYANAGASSYRDLLTGFNDCKDDDTVYVGELNFKMRNLIKGERIIRSYEFGAIETSLALTIARKTNVPGNRVLISI